MSLPALLRHPISSYQFSQSKRAEDIINRKVSEFVSEIERQHLIDVEKCSITKIHETLSKRGVSDLEMKYMTNDFIEKLDLQFDKIHLEFSFPLFPVRKDREIILHIQRFNYNERMTFSADNIADFVLAIRKWSSEYDRIVENAEVDQKKTEMVCKVGMSYLDSVLEEILVPKGYQYQNLPYYDADDVTIVQIKLGNGISLNIEINLLEDFHEKIQEVLHRI